MEAHDNHIDLLYLTDSEVSLQAIHKWIGCGAKLNLSKSPDADVLKAIILKLRRRVDAGATTLLIKVKAHRGDRNFIRQKAGEIESFKTLEVGALKWCKEHIPRDGNDLTEEGQILLENPELWLDRLTFLWECHASKKRERTTEDGTVQTHSCYIKKELSHQPSQATDY